MGDVRLRDPGRSCMEGVPCETFPSTLPLPLRTSSWEEFCPLISVQTLMIDIVLSRGGAERPRGEARTLASNLPPVERGSRDEQGEIQLDPGHQSPLLGFGWAGDSLPKRRTSDMVTRPSWKLAATTREILGFRVDRTPNPAETAPWSQRSRQSSTLVDGGRQQVGRGLGESFCMHHHHSHPSANDPQRPPLDLPNQRTCTARTTTPTSTSSRPTSTPDGDDGNPRLSNDGLGLRLQHGFNDSNPNKSDRLGPTQKSPSVLGDAKDWGGSSNPLAWFRHSV